MDKQVEQLGWTYKRLRCYSRLRPAVAELVDARIHGNQIKNLETELSTCDRTNQMLDVIEDALQGDHTPKQLESLMVVMLHQAENDMEGHKQLRDAMFILNQGDEILKRLCWTYARDPYLFEKRYAVDCDTFLADRSRCVEFPYLSFAPLIHVKNAGLLLNKEVWSSYKTVLGGEINEAYLQDPRRDEPFRAMINSGLWGSRMVKAGWGVKKALENVENTLYPPISKKLDRTK